MAYIQKSLEIKKHFFTDVTLLIHDQLKLHYVSFLLPIGYKERIQPYIEDYKVKDGETFQDKMKFVVEDASLALYDEFFAQR